MKTFCYILFLTILCCFLLDNVEAFAGDGKQKKKISTYNKNIIEPANTGNQSFGMPVPKRISQSVLIDSTINGLSFQSAYTNQIVSYPAQNAIAITHRGEASYSGSGHIHYNWSTDGGASWIRSSAVNAAASQQKARHPSIFTTWNGSSLNVGGVWPELDASWGWIGYWYDTGFGANSPTTVLRNTQSIYNVPEAPFGYGNTLFFGLESVDFTGYWLAKSTNGGQSWSGLDSGVYILRQGIDYSEQISGSFGDFAPDGNNGVWGFLAKPIDSVNYFFGYKITTNGGANWGTTSWILNSSISGLPSYAQKLSYPNSVKMDYNNKIYFIGTFYNNEETQLGVILITNRTGSWVAHEVSQIHFVDAFVDMSQAYETINSECYLARSDDGTKIVVKWIDGTVDSRNMLISDSLYFRCFNANTGNWGDIVSTDANPWRIKWSKLAPRLKFDGSQYHAYVTWPLFSNADTTSLNRSYIYFIDMIVPTGGAPPSAPTANAATSIAQTSFSANWSAASGATGYKIDVSTSNTFSSYVSGYQDLDVSNVTTKSVTGLSGGTTYYYRVRAYNGNGTSGNSGTITVLTIPPNPTAGSATSIAQTNFSANWSAATGATGYRLDVSTSNTFSSYVSGYQDLNVGNVTTRSVTGLSGGTTYYYRVRSVNGSGTSGNSSTITVLTIPPNPTANSASSVAQTSFSANWSAATGATKYYLDVATDNGFTTFVTGYNNKDVGNVTTSSVTSLSGGTTYYYRVRAYNASGNSGNSGTITVLTIPPNPTASSASSVSQTSFSANWTAAFGATGYRLDVSTSNTFSSYVSGYQDLNVNNVTTYSVTGLTAGTDYYYRVRAYNGSGTSGNSGTIPVTTTVNPPPEAPVANNGSSITQNTFSANWNTASGATKYYLDVATDNGFTSFVTNYNNKDVGNVTTASVTGLSGGTTYYYRVRAYNANGTSSNSNTITVLTIPPSPTAYSASSVAQTSFSANWNPAIGATGYRLDVSISNSFTSYVSGYEDLDIGNYSYKNVTGLSAGTTYYYRIRAYNGNGTSGNSSTITVLTIPSSPTANSPSSLAQTSFSANWGAATGATGYQLDVATDNGFTSFVAGYDNADVGNVTTASVTGLSTGTTYYYRVRAYNGSGNSGNSNTISVLLMVPPSFIGAPFTDPATLGVGNWTYVNARITGTSLTITLYYANSSLTSINQKGMGFVGGDTARTNIETGYLTVGGLCYRIKAENTAGTAYYPSATGWVNIPINLEASNFVTVLSSSGFPQTFPAKKFFTVALPCGSSSVNLISLWGAQQFNSSNITTNWRAGTFNPVTQTFSDVTILNPNTAYVIYNSDGLHPFTSITSGQTNAPGLLDNITLYQGWNLIPWPYAATANVTVTNATEIDPIWYLDNTGWHASTSQFKPFRAYAVRKKTSGSISLMNVISISSTLAKTEPADFGWNWSLKLSATSGDHYDLDNYLGAGENALNEYDPADASEPMYMQDGISMYFTQSDQKLAFDIRSSDDSGQIWNAVLMNHTSQSTANLSWNNEQLQNGWLVDMDNNRFINLKEQNSYTFRSLREHRFKVIAGEMNYVEKEIEALRKVMPSVFHLYTNYPNPFNPNTTIRFDVAKTGNVKLQVYNILGQLVATLINGTMETGKYDIQWNGKDIRGRTVSSGIYIYRLVADGYVKCRKMILVR